LSVRDGDLSAPGALEGLLSHANDELGDTVLMGGRGQENSPRASPRNTRGRPGTAHIEPRIIPGTTSESHSFPRFFLVFYAVAQFLILLHLSLLENMSFVSKESQCTTLIKISTGTGTGQKNKTKTDSKLMLKREIKFWF